MTRSGPPLASCSCCYHCSSEKNVTQSAPTNKYKSSKKFLNHATVVAFIVISLSNLQQPCEAAFYGKPLGKLTEYHHGVSGEVFAVDARTLYIKDLTYDGEGPAAYFYVGNSKAPIINGFRVPDEKGRTGLLRKYRKEDITLTLPEGKTLNNIRWFSLWCDDFSVNFGDVKIPRGFDYPRPQKLGTLSGIHGVSSEPIVVVDAQTLLIPGFSYDGEAPDAKFWAGPGPSPTPQGIKIPDENGKTVPLRRYVQKTIVLTLPGDLTVHQLGHFGVWCEAFTVDFGHVKIPQNLNVPPSLKMLGVSPQSKLNCEILQDDLAFEVRWAVAGDSVVFQLVAKLDDGQYMSFGLSPDPKKTVMIGGDVVVAWVDKQTLQGYAVDYFLDAKSQCSGRRGSCPDIRIQDDTNSVSLLNAAMVNGYSIVTYQRPLKASDELDLPITTNGSQAIIWAIGPLNERKEVSFHSEYLKKDQFIEFGRPPRWNCPMPDTLDNEKVLVNKDKDSTSQQTAITTRRPSHGPATPAPASKKGAWVIPPIQCDEPEDGVFYAQMGPTGGKHGYSAITGHVGWGVSWYINGLLIPEINVVRGKKYSFIVEAGLDSEVPARYHPFYITDDSVGGYQHKTPEEKANVTIYAGVERIRGKTKLTGVGRFCYWTPDQNVDSDDFSSFGAYQRTLTLKCDAGEDPGVVHWTPDKNTPDTVYYQCYTHRYLGWKINVHDDCEISPEGAASEVREVYAKAPEASDEFSDLDSESSGSVRVSSKVTPGQEFFQEHREYTRNPSFIANTLLPASGKPNNHHNHHYNLHHQSSSPAKASASTITQLIRFNNNNSPSFESYDDLRDSETKTVIIHPQFTQNSHGKNSPPIGRLQGPSGKLVNKKSNPSTFVGYEVREREQDTRLSNNQKIIPLAATYGLKFAFAHGAPGLLARPNLANPDPQILLVQRRPTQQTRRPMLQQLPGRTGLVFTGMQNQRPSNDQYLQLIEGRKKTIYRVPSLQQHALSSISPSSPSLLSSTPSKRYNVQSLTKLTKNDLNQLNTIESKMSQTDVQQQTAKPTVPTDPARNTGFKPESVVVEGGFKPIIRITDVTKFAEDRRFEGGSSEIDDDIPENSKEYRPLDSFEPMFVPSPPDRNQSKKRNQMMRKKAQLLINKQRLNDESTDMETAADRLEAYYLPAVPAGAVENPTGLKLTRLNKEVNEGRLVTADGTQVQDQNLARSIPRVSSERLRSRISSDALSRTPQFGQFRGELPPPIPGDLRTDNIPQLQQQNFRKITTSSSGSLYKDRNNNHSGTTRLTVVQRSRRSAHHVPGHDDSNDGMNNTESVVTHAQVTPTINQKNNHDIPGEHDHHDHSQHDHSKHIHQNENGNTESPSAGELIMANIKWIVLTVILYFVI